MFRLNHLSFFTILFIVAGMSCFFPEPARGQIRSGGAFLKMLPGARHHGMAGSLTGTIDAMHAFYANPAATGFLREWQWSTTYTEWIADIYNLSLMYGSKIRTPWSAKSKIALGIHYQGIREFDSTNRSQSAASANDLLVTASFGHPLNVISKNIASGLNVKYIRSKLADYSASAWILDFGLLYRTNRFKIKTGLIDYGIFSAGVAVTQFGSSLNFISYDTPLPRTLRAGAAFNFGSHTGLQIQFSTDYQKVRDEIGRFSFGTEISWNYLLAIRGGYNFNSHILSKFSFGMSLRLDSQTSPVKNVLPGKSNALRLDIAGLEKNDLFSTSFRGGVSHYPIGPEKFDLVEPFSGKPFETDSLKFSWDATKDPDLYDEVNYLLIIEKAEGIESASNILTRLIQETENTNDDLFQIVDKNRSSSLYVINSGFVVNRELNQLSYMQKQLSNGDYFWSVAAYDNDNHFRFAEKDGAPISHFRILPDLLITEIQFLPDKWITEDDYQGELLITVSNNSNVKSLKNTLVVFDSLLTHPTNNTNGHAHTDKIKHAFEPVSIFGVSAKSDTTIVLKWFTQWHGKHQIRTEIYKSSQFVKSNETNNNHQATFYTIPKGAFKTGDKVIAAIDSVYEYELPFIPKIFFEHNSAEINQNKSALIYSPLEILVKRLREQQNLKLKLQGFADATNGESENLAKAREQAVKDYFLKHDIPDRLIEIHETLEPGQIITNLNPKFEPDRDWVQKERRYVKITSSRIDSENEEVADVFYSVPLTLPKSKRFLPVVFVSTIKSYVALNYGKIQIHADSLNTNMNFVNFVDHRADTVAWQHYSNDNSVWLNKNTNYSVVLKDTLGREFYTKERQTNLELVKCNLLPNKIIVGVAEFKQDFPSTNLYWLNVLEKVKQRLENFASLRLQFIGHACAIGSQVVNQSLSTKRAKKFQKEFLYEIKNQEPELLKRIEIRLDKYAGKGESEPLHFEIEKNNFLRAVKILNFDEYQTLTKLMDAGKKRIKFYPFILDIKNNKIKIISDNATTLGRQINRRIEILVKNPGEEKFTTKKSSF